jgi:isopentenyl-diphosphate delta-isomerase
VDEAAARRLKEEMGMVCDLQSPFWFIYQTAFENGLSEHELDHVFMGYSDGPFRIDSNEVQAALWISLADLEAWMDRRPEDFTFWFKHIYPRCAEAFRDNPNLR